jgi:large subunit ribosomal protein L17
LNIKEKRKIKNLTYHLIKKGRITTTVPTAKLVKKSIEKMITRAKKDTVVNRRYIAGKLPKDGVGRLFEVIGPANIERNGGYTRLLRIEDNRKGDGSQMCLLEIINV